MKKLLTLLLAMSMVLSLAACSSSDTQQAAPEANPETAQTEETAEQSDADAEEADEATDADAEKAPIDGYATFADETVGITFQYPEGWLEVSEATLDSPEVAAAMQDLTGMDSDMVRQALQMMVVSFYNNNPEEGLTDSFVPNMNLVSSSSGGIDQSMMADQQMLSQLKDQLEGQYSQMFDGFAWVQGPESKEIGGNTVITISTEYNLAGIELSAYQSFTENDGQLYTFTYTTTKGALTDAMLETLETIVGSIQF